MKRVRYTPTSGPICGCPDGTCYYPSSAVCEIVDVVNLDDAIKKLEKRVDEYVRHHKVLQAHATAGHTLTARLSIVEKQIEARRTRLKALVMLRSQL